MEREEPEEAGPSRENPPEAEGAPAQPDTNRVKVTVKTSVKNINLCFMLKSPKYHLRIQLRKHKFSELPHHSLSIYIPRGNPGLSLWQPAQFYCATQYQ
jgi:hypothetical protein